MIRRSPRPARRAHRCATRPWPSRRRRAPRRAASSGWMCSVQRGLPFTSTGRLCIHELFERRWRRPTSTSAVVEVAVEHALRRRATSASTGSGASSIIPLGVRSTSGRRGSSAPRSMPCGEQLVERQAARGAEALAVGTGAQHEVEEALGTGARRERGEDLVGVAAVDRARLVGDARVDQPADGEVVDHRRVGVGAHALEDERELGEDLPLVGLAGRELEDRRRVVGDVADRELQQRDVVVRLRQRVGRRAGSRRRGGWSRSRRCRPTP